MESSRWTFQSTQFSYLVIQFHSVTLQHQIFYSNWADIADTEAAKELFSSWKEFHISLMFVFISVIASMARNSLLCAEVLLRNYSLTHSSSLIIIASLTPEDDAPPTSPAGNCATVGLLRLTCIISMFSWSQSMTLSIRQWYCCTVFSTRFLLNLVPTAKAILLA